MADTKVSNLTAATDLVAAEIAGQQGGTSKKFTVAIFDARYQGLDSDLTSWAGITRASGFDTWVATPSSANLRSLLTDETGTGAAVFATAPTITGPVITTTAVDLQIGQITFPASQNSSSNVNTLDDYERGTTTPTWTGSITNPAIGNGTLSGTYVKIGRLVHFDLLMQTGSTTTYGSGVWSFTLPFTAASTGGAGTVSGFDAGTANRVGAVQILTTTTIGFVSDAGGNNWGQLIPHTWANGDYLKASITYVAAS